MARAVGGGHRDGGGNGQQQTGGPAKRLCQFTVARWHSGNGSGESGRVPGLAFTGARGVGKRRGPGPGSARAASGERGGWVVGLGGLARGGEVGCGEEVGRGGCAAGSYHQGVRAGALRAWEDDYQGWVAKVVGQVHEKGALAVA